MSIYQKQQHLNRQLCEVRRLLYLLPSHQRLLPVHTSIDFPSQGFQWCHPATALIAAYSPTRRLIECAIHHVPGTSNDPTILSRNGCRRSTAPKEEASRIQRRWTAALVTSHPFLYSEGGGPGGRGCDYFTAVASLDLVGSAATMIRLGKSGGSSGTTI